MRYDAVLRVLHSARKFCFSVHKNLISGSRGHWKRGSVRTNVWSTKATSSRGCENRARIRLKRMSGSKGCARPNRYRYRCSFSS